MSEKDEMLSARPFFDESSIENILYLRRLVLFYKKFTGAYFFYWAYLPEYDLKKMPNLLKHFPPE